MKQLLQLTLLQIRDKIDFSWVKSKKTLIQTIVFTLIKFIAVVAVVYIVLFALALLGILSKYQDVLPLFTIFLTILFILNTATSTHNLMKSLYFADDNKLLITFPLSANKMFISKILMYFVFELKKSFELLVPGVLGFLIFEFSGYLGTEVTFWTFIWMIVPIFVFVLIQVLLASILSIPFLYIYRFLKKNTIFDLIAVIVLLALGLFVVINLISLIPEDIDLNRQWSSFVAGFENIILLIDRYAYPLNLYSRVFFGEVAQSGIHYQLSYVTFIKLFISLTS